MNYEQAKSVCAVRSAIYRTGDPTKVYSQSDLDKVHDALKDLNAEKLGKTVPKVYWKNHPKSLDSRIPDADKLENDWEEYDPRERPECAAYEEMPA